jgi:hypothetical protein
MDMASTPSLERRDYRLRYWTFLPSTGGSGLFLLFGVCCGVCGWRIHDNEAMVTGLGFAILSLALMMWGAFIFRNTRLTLAPDGIEVRGAVINSPIVTVGRAPVVYNGITSPVSGSNRGIRGWS